MTRTDSGVEAPVTQKALLEANDRWPQDTRTGAIRRDSFIKGAEWSVSIERQAAASEPLRAALKDANHIIAMTRQHLAQDHPDCAYDGLGLMNDATRAALAAAPAPSGLTEWECGSLKDGYQCSRPVGHKGMHRKRLSTGLTAEALAEAIEGHVRHRLSFHDASTCDKDCAPDILSRLSPTAAGPEASS